MVKFCKIDNKINIIGLVSKYINTNNKQIFSYIIEVLENIYAIQIKHGILNYLYWYQN